MWKRILSWVLHARKMIITNCMGKLDYSILISHRMTSLCRRVLVYVYVECWQHRNKDIERERDLYARFGAITGPKSNSTKLDKQFMDLNAMHIEWYTCTHCPLEINIISRFLNKSEAQTSTKRFFKVILQGRSYSITSK